MHIGTEMRNRSKQFIYIEHSFQLSAAESVSVQFSYNRNRLKIKQTISM